jgi:hypothetical protein
MSIQTFTQKILMSSILFKKQQTYMISLRSKIIQQVNKNIYFSVGRTKLYKLDIVLDVFSYVSTHSDDLELIPTTCS